MREGGWEGGGRDGGGRERGREGEKEEKEFKNLVDSTGRGI